MSDLDISRRNILTVLGIAAVTQPTFAAEQIDSGLKGPAGVPGVAIPSIETQKRFARVMAEAAAAIHRGDLTCLGMKVNSTMTLADWFQHKVTFTFELPMEAATPLA